MGQKWNQIYYDYKIYFLYSVVLFYFSKTVYVLSKYMYIPKNVHNYYILIICVFAKKLNY